MNNGGKLKILIGFGNEEIRLILPELLRAGVDVDDEEMLYEWCRSGTKNDDPLKLLALAKFTWHGFFRHEDIEETLSLLEHPILKNYSPAIHLKFSLLEDIAYRTGLPPPEFNDDFLDLVKNKYPPAMLTYAMRLGEKNGENCSEKIQLLNEAAELGSLIAMHYVGNNLLSSQNKPDVAKGIAMLESAADQNHAFCCSDLADIYRHGRYGKEKNLLKAIMYEQKQKEFQPTIFENNPDSHG